MKTETWKVLVRPQSSKSLMVATLLSDLPRVAPPLASSQVVSSTLNPEQIATLHWYHANRTTTFAVGARLFQKHIGEHA